MVFPVPARLKEAGTLLELEVVAVLADEDEPAVELRVGARLRLSVFSLLRGTWQQTPPSAALARGRWAANAPPCQLGSGSHVRPPRVSRTPRFRTPVYN